jgi:hypothetical protein
MSNNHIYDDVVFEDNRYIEPPPQLLSLAEHIFDMIESKLEYSKKDRNIFFDSLSFKLNNLISAYRSNCNLVYSRDSKLYLKKYCTTENKHFWSSSILSKVSDALEAGFYIRQIKGNNLIGYRTVALIRPYLANELRQIIPYKIKMSDNLDSIELRRREEIIRTDGKIKYRQIPMSYKDGQDNRIPMIRQELAEIYKFYKNQDIAGFIPDFISSTNPEYAKRLNQYDATGKIDIVRLKKWDRV